MNALSVVVSSDAAEPGDAAVPTSDAQAVSRSSVPLDKFVIFDGGTLNFDDVLLR
jgi:hypothetical protein